MTDPSQAPRVECPLLPCPYCGSKGRLYYDNDTPMSAKHGVRCVQEGEPCGADVGTYLHANGAIAAWNRRPTPTPPTEAEERRVFEAWHTSRFGSCDARGIGRTMIENRFETWRAGRKQLREGG